MMWFGLVFGVGCLSVCQSCFRKCDWGDWTVWGKGSPTGRHVFPQQMISCCSGLFQTFLLGGALGATEVDWETITRSWEQEKGGSQIKKWVRKSELPFQLELSQNPQIWYSFCFQLKNCTSPDQFLSTSAHLEVLSVYPAHVSCTYSLSSIGAVFAITCLFYIIICISIGVVICLM